MEDIFPTENFYVDYNVHQLDDLQTYSYSLRYLIHDFITSTFQTCTADIQLIQCKLCQSKSSGKIKMCELEMQDVVAWLLSKSLPENHRVWRALQSMEKGYALYF